ncbi:hypothetical protein BKA67DRAFT_661591 [Truncatella angustata]|uniref:DUF1275 domain protein n=1 Tax=Truncatella angustata TaxID=152316 RepID=A0A9P8UES0_9PEZI|nr:uncharacterized protein BKA67DRAFT_661591 [Truncatella angustata]KAH6648630.1 hypothetical protein BKA67DRAFT_661591 [Truncatella angustata]KAH8196195.1 hypothetical protein TruAng_009638 [Truncatella angustata]
MAPENGYGTVNNGTTGTRTNPRGDEEQALLGRSASKPSWRSYLTATVNRDWADLILLLCYFVTGLLDSASINTWGSFVSMQTGNTVYIGLGLAAPSESTRWIKSGTSLISFCVGSFAFSRFHRYFLPSRRWVLCASFLLQMTLVIAAAGILTWGPKSDDELSWVVLVPIALVAFQSCGQAVISRALKYNALTSVVLTSIYCDLFSDAELFTRENTERNRRVGAPVLLLLGAVVGGILVRSEFGAAGTLWFAAVLKLLVAVTWFFWRAAE